MQSAHDLLTRWPALDVAEKAARLQRSLHLSPGALANTLSTAVATADRAGAALWTADPTAWSADPDVQKTIADRFGWMTSPALMADSIGRLQTFAARVKADGFTDVVMLGMGGSTLAPEVLHRILGVAPGWPRFHMLDSTDPAAIRAIATPPRQTLYIVASKSGSTIEPNVLAAHFFEQVTQAGVATPAANFVAITDEGSSLALRARAERFRDLFINPSDIGGRYSALSFFGMVPSALMGQDIAAIIGWGLAMLSASRPEAAGAQENPATGLGLAIGEGGRTGRDKLTLIVPDTLDPFGLWVEQLIAESTGKLGRGIVPICGEELADPSRYGGDRLYVRIRKHDAADESNREAVLGRLKSEQAPVAEIDLPEMSAIGAEFVRWEIATAVAGAIIKIDPFDQPNVQQAKDGTNALLKQYKASGTLPIDAADETLPNGVTLTLTPAARAALTTGAASILSLIRAGDYFALLAYLDFDPALGAELRTLRRDVRDRIRAATMFGYGPRYLHSTGQLHKGGPNSGVFVLVSAAPVEDLAIPGESFSFGTLEHAQALGDFASLAAAGRRGLHVRLPSPDPALLHDIAATLLSTLSPSR